VNHVLLVGRVEQHPESRPNPSGTDYLLYLAVQRRELGSGGPLPGVSYLEVVVPWPQSRAYGELRKGEIVAVSGLIERNEFRDADGRWRSEHRIVADWVEQLVHPEPT
jgi:single-stranded DNA-binding protein